MHRADLSEARFGCRTQPDKRASTDLGVEVATTTAARQALLTPTKEGLPKLEVAAPSDNETSLMVAFRQSVAIGTEAIL